MKGRLLYVVTEDWFFRSHFLPMADAARRAGLDVLVACRCGEARAELEARGLTVLPLEGARSGLSPVSVWREAAAIRRAIAGHEVDLVHFIALRPILIGFVLAAAGARHRSVYALTGRGYLGVSASAGARAMRALLRAVGPWIARRKSWFLFENRDDPAFFGLDPGKAPNITFLGGAGVDPERWTVSPMPADGPLRVAFVGRMLRFKGVADLVEAVAAARAAGRKIELSLFGEPDPHNPASIRRAELEAWGARDGVVWHGRTSDVRGVWASHHVAVQPSHEAEGLPLSLLEAAASGRALVATDTPGCRDFVRDGADGLLVPPRAPRAIADALIRLADDRGLARRLGDAARRRIFDGFTADSVAEKVVDAYARLLLSR